MTTLAEAHDALRATGVCVAKGLASHELERVEAEFGFRFPPDLREFLSMGLPISGAWLDWRNAPHCKIRERMDWPVEGICFDIEHNEFWLDEWGMRPSQLRDALAFARKMLEDAPRLIPINAHRYMPDRPARAGNPVLSVYQTDVIYYGNDLLDYLAGECRERFSGTVHSDRVEPRLVKFWSKLVT